MLKQIQKVFVTNPTGVIGAHTVNSFIRAGYQVHCLLKQPTHTRDALLETRFNDTRLQPFMIPPDAQPGTVDHDTACDKALDGVNAIVYTGPGTVPELANWQRLIAGVRPLLASAERVGAPIKSLVLHTPAGGIGPLFLPKTNPEAAPDPVPETVPTRDLAQIWAPTPDQTRTDDIIHPAPPFSVTSIASVPALGLRPALDPDLFPPTFREEVTSLQELDQFPPSLFTHPWVDPRDLAEIFVNVVSREVYLSDVLKDLERGKSKGQESALTPVLSRLTKYLVAPPQTDAARKALVTALIKLHYPNHPGGNYSTTAHYISEIGQTEQSRTRSLLGRDWTPADKTIKEILGHSGPSIQAMTENCQNLQRQVYTFFMTEGFPAEKDDPSSLEERDPKLLTTSSTSPPASTAPDQATPLNIWDSIVSQEDLPPKPAFRRVLRKEQKQMREEKRERSKWEEIPE